MAFSLNCRQLHPDPDLGPLKHDHKLTLIFFSEGDSQNPWIKRGDPTVIWPRDWLPKEEGLGDNILVLSVECYVDPKTAPSVPLERILVRDLVMNPKWELDRAQTIVLVGHGLGGLVIKSLCFVENSQEKRCKAFKQNIKGIVFYSVPHTTSQEESIEQQHIKLFAFVEGQKVMVPQSSTYKLVQNNVCEIEDADHFQVSQPLDQQHASYKRLLQFIQEDLGHHFQGSQPLDQQHASYEPCWFHGDYEESERFQALLQTRDQNNASYKRLRPALTYLPRETKQEVGTSTRTNETKGVPNQQQKLDVIIRTNETEGVPNQQQKLDVMIKTNETEGVPNQQQRLDVMIRTNEVEGVPNQQQKLDVMIKTNETEGVPNQQQRLDVMIRTNEVEGVPNQQQKLDVMIKTIEDVPIKSPKDLQSLTLEEVLGKTSILCVGGKAEEGDSVEFLFMHAGDMAKVVGVGLDWAKVVVTKEFGVNVVQEDEGIWTKLWCLEYFVPRIITIPNPKQELMTHPNSAKTDGVELEANLGCVYVEDGKEENAHACFPLVFELVEHIGLRREYVMKMKEVSGEGSNGSTKGGEVSGAKSSGPTEGGEATKGGEASGVKSSGSTKGGEVSGAESSGPIEGGEATEGGEASGVKSSGSTKDGEVSREKSNQSTSSGSRQETRRNENDEGSEDPSRGPPNSLNPSLSVVPQDEDERTFTVNVFPKSKQIVFPSPGFWQFFSPLRGSSCISPKLVFKFQKKGRWRTIMSKTETSCSFGEMENEATGHGFRFYQDNITISLECNDEDFDAARVSQPGVQDVEFVKETITDTTTTITNSQGQVGGGIGGVDISNFPIHAQATCNYTSSGGTNSTQGSNHDVPFVQLSHYHVNDRCSPKKLRYNFEYPQHILQQIASSDLSKIKTENTFWATIVGNWEGLNYKMSPYVFSVKGDIISKEELRQSIGNSRHTPILKKQDYEVALKVNHAMTHMPHKDTDELSESNNILKIDHVMEMEPSTSHVMEMEPSTSHVMEMEHSTSHVMEIEPSTSHVIEMEPSTSI